MSRDIQAVPGSARIETSPLPERRGLLSAWGLVWLVSVLFVLEPHIRSIGKPVEDSGVLATELLPKFWLSDLGLLLPIACAWRELSKRAHHSRGLKLGFLAVASAGLAVGLLNHNIFSDITSDVRTLLGCVTGYCLLLLLPATKRATAYGLFALTAIGVVVAMANVLLMPGGTLDSEKAVTASSCFLALNVVNSLVGPALVFAAYARRGWIAIGASVLFGVLLAGTTLVMETRTASISILGGAACAVLSLTRLARSGDAQLNASRLLGGLATAIAICGLLAMTGWGSQRLEAFLDRFSGGGQQLFRYDQNWRGRVDEFNRARETMDTAAYAVGRGLGAATTTPDYDTGANSIGLHIGIMTVPWKFGLGVFGLLVVGIISSLSSYTRVAWDKGTVVLTDQEVAWLVAGPGLAAAVVVGCFSGGWSKEMMLGLGFLYGVCERCRWGELAGGEAPDDRPGWPEGRAGRRLRTRAVQRNSVSGAASREQDCVFGRISKGLPP